MCNNYFTGQIPMYRATDTRSLKTGFKFEEKDFEFDFSLFNNLNPENQSAYISKYTTDRKELWQRVLMQKESDVNAQTIFEKYSSIFEKKKNFKTIISKKFDESFMSEGFFAGELYTLTAPSGTCKTAFCIMQSLVLAMGKNHFAELKLDQPRKVVYASLEQTKEQIIARFKSLCLAFNDLKNTLPFTELLKNNFNNFNTNNLANEIFKLYENNIIVLDSQDFEDDLNIKNILEVLDQYSFDFLVIDQYENIEEATLYNKDDIVKEIKKFAHSKNIPVYLQVQIKKNSLEKATNSNGIVESKRITSQSMRGSSGIEHQSSNVLVFTDLGETKEIHGFTATLLNIAKLKARYGEKKSIRIWHIGALNLFIDESEDIEL